jgi:hypothetical protein
LLKKFQVTQTLPSHLLHSWQFIKIYSILINWQMTKREIFTHIFFLIDMRSISLPCVCVCLNKYLCELISIVKIKCKNWWQRLWWEGVRNNILAFIELTFFFDLDHTRTKKCWQANWHKHLMGCGDKNPYRKLIKLFYVQYHSV